MTPSGGVHFVYGTLRPGELAYNQVAQFVKNSAEATVDGWELAVRDGLPLIRPHPTSAVEGDVLFPVPESEAGLADAIQAYEGTALYRPQVVKASTLAGPISATAYIGIAPNKGSPVVIDRPWQSVDDPLLSAGLDAVAKLARDHFVSVRPLPADMPGFWESFVPLQGLYLTLCSILERYTALVFGPNLGPAGRVALLRDCPEAQRAVRETQPPAIRVVDSRDPNDTARAPGRKAFDAWYMARSNLSHRGKSAFADFRVIERSLVGLHDALRRLLEIQLGPEHQVHFSTNDDRMLAAIYRRVREEPSGAGG